MLLHLSACLTSLLNVRWLRWNQVMIKITSLPSFTSITSTIFTYSCFPSSSSYQSPPAPPPPPPSSPPLAVTRRSSSRRQQSSVCCLTDDIIQKQLWIENWKLHSLKKKQKQNIFNKQKSLFKNVFKNKLYLYSTVYCACI